MKISCHYCDINNLTTEHMKYFSTHRKKPQQLSITRFALLQTRQIRTQHCRDVGVDRKVAKSFLVANGDNHFEGPESG